MPNSLHWIEWLIILISNQSPSHGILTVLNANESILEGVVHSFKSQPISIGWSGWQFEIPTNADWMNWSTVSNSNQSTLDRVVDPFNYQPTYTGWSGWQFEMPTNLHCIKWLPVLKDNQSILDGVVDSFKCDPLHWTESLTFLIAN